MIFAALSGCRKSNFWITVISIVRVWGAGWFRLLGYFLFVVVELFPANIFHNVAEQFDFRHKRVDILFGDDEIIGIPGFDVSAS